MTAQFDLYEYETDTPYEAFLDFDYVEMEFYGQKYIYYPKFDYLQELKDDEDSEDSEDPVASEEEIYELY